MSYMSPKAKAPQQELPSSEDIAHEIARLSELYEDLKERERSQQNQVDGTSSNQETKRLRQLLDDAQDKLYKSEKSSKDKLKAQEFEFQRQIEFESYTNKKLNRQIAKLEKDLELEKKAREQERETAKRTLETNFNQHDIQLRHLEMQLDSSQRQVEEITETMTQQVHRIERQLKHEQEARVNDRVLAKRHLDKEYEQNDKHIQQLERTIEDVQKNCSEEIETLKATNIKLSQQIEKHQLEQSRNEQLLQKTREELHHTHLTYQRQLKHLEEQLKNN